MYDPIGRAIVLLDAEAPKKDITAHADPMDPRRRSYVVPIGNGRRQAVYAAPVADPLFRERLDLMSLCVHELPADAGLLCSLLVAARDLRRARICITEPTRLQLAVVASFVPEEIHDGAGPRLLHALREVAAVADSIEAQLTGADHA